MSSYLFFEVSNEFKSAQILRDQMRAREIIRQNIRREEIRKIEHCLNAAEAFRKSQNDK